MDPQRTEPLTDEMIADLGREAGQAGDGETAQLCEDAAFEFDREKRKQVAKIINDARAMDDSKEFVMVVSYQGHAPARKPTLGTPQVEQLFKLYR